MIELYSLGAAEEVGRSCFVARLGGLLVMLDCGVHLGFDDERMFPRFVEHDALLRSVACVVISHFHMDHLAALPYFVKKYAFRGPIFMTHPTQAILPVLLQDFMEKSLESSFYSESDIEACLHQSIPLSFRQEFVYRGLRLTPFPAGHVLGAAMFLLCAPSPLSGPDESLLYTGDFSTIADHHLPSATCPPSLRPTVLLSESTYAGSLRAPRLEREAEFLQAVRHAVDAGGKVLVPVFALGRAQELCTLLARSAEIVRAAPIFLSGGLSARANRCYEDFVQWCNESVQSTFAEHGFFSEATHRTFSRHMIGDPSPKIVFASPGMLHSGLSLEIFEAWCGDARNLLLLPGYCVQGTIGARLIAGERELTVGDRPLHVRCGVQYLSFSAHADARGLLQLVDLARPRSVVLVHGARPQMDAFQRYLAARHPDIPLRIARFGVCLRWGADGTLLSSSSSSGSRP